MELFPSTGPTCVEEGTSLQEGFSSDIGVEEKQQHDNKKRRQVGRAARRRRRKHKEIQRTEELLLRGGEGEVVAPQPQVLPVDRSRVWPAVQALRKLYGNSGWTAADAAALTGQLGYLPGNAIRIAARVRDVAAVLKQQHGLADNDDDPVVVQLYPLVWRDPHDGGKAGRQFKSRKRQRQLQPPRGHENAECSAIDASKAESNAAVQSESSEMLMEPFPTTYWLTHPHLRCLVSQLEVEGYGTQLEQRLAHEPDSLARMHCAHAAYGRERWNLLHEADARLVQARGWDDTAFAVTRGVAGMAPRAHGAVKCLHAHAAHYLSGRAGSADNVVGRWVVERLQQQQSVTPAKNDTM